MPSRPLSRTAFTLVELIVVIGIIALLISILLPSLAKAREQVNRVQCAANLRSLGQFSVMFANEHKGTFPAAWGYGQDGGAGWNGVSFPVLLNYNPLNDESPDTWRRFGTSYQRLARYARTQGGADVPYLNGGTVKLAGWLTCPSVGDAPGEKYQAWSNIGGGYGWAIQTSYVYVAGIPQRTVGTYPQFPGGPINHLSGYNWGQRPPAVKLSDKGQRVLATDTVWWEGGGAQGNGYVINHPDRRDAKVPAFQNILYADGHVSGEKPMFTDAVTGVKSGKLTVNSWSLAHEVAGAYAGRYFYWGQ